MKRVVILGIALLVLATGCGQQTNYNYTTNKEDQMICTRTANANGLEMDFHYEVYYQGNDVNKVQTTEKITSDSNELLQTYQQQIKSLYSNFDNIEHYNYDVKIEGNTLISTTDINYQKMNIDELVNVDSSIEQLLNDDRKIDLDKITQVYEQLGATCEK